MGILCERNKGDAVDAQRFHIHRTADSICASSHLTDADRRQVEPGCLGGHIAVDAIAAVDLAHPRGFIDRSAA